MDYTAILLIIGLFVLSYVLAYRYHKPGDKKHESLLSLSSGMLVVLILAELLPRIYLYSHEQNIQIIISAAIVCGFLIHHLIEKYIYQHGQKLIEKKKELTEFHLSGNILENMIKGFVLVSLFYVEDIGIVKILALVPLFTENMSRAVLLAHRSKQIKLGNAVFVFIIVSIILGSLLAIFTIRDTQATSFYVVFSLMVGAFTYFVIRDEIPHGRHGKPLFFTLGVLLSIIALVLVQ